MKSRAFRAIINAFALAASLSLVAPSGAAGQQPAGGGSVSLSNESGKVSVKLERGSRVAISNRYGRITITGWDRDTVEAIATGPKGPEAIQVEMTADPQARSVLSLAVAGRTRTGPYAATAPTPATQPRPNPGPKPAPTPDAAREKQREQQKAAEDAVRAQIKEAAKNGVILVPVPDVRIEIPNVVIEPGGVWVPTAPGTPASNQAITLDVKVPRYAALDAIEVRSGDLNVSGIDGPVSVVSGSSNVTANHVGSLEVRTRSGNITAEDVEGIVYVVASSGDINVRRSNGDVRATSTNGNINVQCVRGRVDASNVRGEITLTNVGGDADATTTDSPIVFTGPIAKNGRYRLKSMEGKVTMSIPDSSPGFTATLMSYNSDATTDFPVRNDSTQHAQTARRLEARQGDGQAQITLDSFNQAVRLARLAGPPPACQ